MQPKVKEGLPAFWQAKTRDAAVSLVHFIERFVPNYSKTPTRLAKDKEGMLTFYEHPAENRQHIRTANPIEPVFASVRLKTTETKHYGPGHNTDNEIQIDGNGPEKMVSHT